MHRLHAKCTRNDGLGEAIHHEVLHSTIDRVYRSFRVEDVSGQWACPTQQSQPVCGCVKVVEAAVARIHTLFLLHRGSPVRPSPSWSPLSSGRQTAALQAWSCCRAQYLGKAASRCSFCPQAGVSITGFLHHVVIFSHQQCFQFMLSQQLFLQPHQIVAWTCAQQIIHVYAKKKFSSFMLKHPWMGDRLCELHVKWCLPEMVLPNRGVASSMHGAFKLADVSTRC